MAAPLVHTDLDTDALRSALKGAAIDLQAHFYQEDGDIYRVEDLQRALENWLELSIESLVDDALFHVIDGDRSSAFNRSAFEAQMKRIRPVEVSEARQPVVPIVRAA